MKPLILGTLVLLTSLLTIPQVPGRLLSREDIVYAGSFRLPDEAGPGDYRCYEHQYPGAIAYNPSANSLLLVGHDHIQWVGEVEIPADLSGLVIAKPRFPCRDILEGRGGEVAGDWKIGGLYPAGDQLIVAVFSYYDASHSARVSHFVRSSNLLQTNSVRGPVRVGSLPVAYTAGYMAPIPSLWQAAFRGDLLTGQCCVSIISRSSFGPAVSAATLADVLTLRTPVPARPLVGYTEDDPLVPYGAKGTHLLWNGATRIRGVVFPEDTSTVLFFGFHGWGESCYGSGEKCKDPESPYQGEHAYPYHPTVWAYDARDLAQVASGRRRMWWPKPYGMWRLPAQISGARVAGAATDPGSGRIYVLEEYGDGARGRVHVLTLRQADAGR